MNQLIPAKKDGENSDTLRIKTTLTGGLAERQIYSPFFLPSSGSGCCITEYQHGRKPDRYTQA